MTRKHYDLHTLKMDNNLVGLFGIDMLSTDNIHNINYIDDNDNNNDMHILEKYKENINEINVFFDTYDIAFSGLCDYIRDIDCKIALLQNLSIISAHDKVNIISCYEIYNLHKKLCYIYEDKMTFFIYKSNDEIVSDIKYLNIMNINKNNINLLNNLPLNIEYLHISSRDDNFDNLNLPLNLKKLTITLIDNEYNNFNIKLPFGCEFECNYIMYY